MAHVLTSAAPAALSNKLIWTGRVLTGLTAAFLLLDGAMKLVPIAPVIEACQRLGYDPSLARSLGLLLITCTIVHLIPRTQLLGAVLLTAYLGGATASHVRVGDPCWFTVVMGVILWAGLYLREPRLRTLLAPAS
jgi:DoxX-like protein